MISGKEIFSSSKGVIRRRLKTEHTYAADLYLNGRTHELWFDCRELQEVDVPHDDVALVASLLMWMEAGTDVHVEGTVTERLLQNLDELQAIWHSWRPEKYQLVAISADNISPTVRDSNEAVLAYSGGLDAHFSLLRHVRQLAGHRTSRVTKAMLVHGLDIDLNDHETFEKNSQRAKRCLGVEGIPLTVVRTNFRSLPMAWQDAHGLGIAACLQLYSSEAGVGLIASGKPYNRLTPWGSSPITDHLMSSGSMEIRNDGAGYSRTEKAQLAVAHSKTLADLRVCWQGDKLERNCGNCEKCSRTYWNLHVAGSKNPPCFTELEIPSYRVHTGPRDIEEWLSILEMAIEVGDREAIKYSRVVVLNNRFRGVLRSSKTLRRLVGRARGR